MGKRWKYLENKIEEWRLDVTCNRVIGKETHSESSIDTKHNWAGLRLGDKLKKCRYAAMRACAQVHWREKRKAETNLKVLGKALWLIEGWKKGAIEGDSKTRSGKEVLHRFRKELLSIFPREEILFPQENLEWKTKQNKT